LSICEGLVGIGSLEREGRLALQASCRSSHRITKMCFGRLGGRPAKRDELFFLTAGGAVGVIGGLDATSHRELSKLEVMKTDPDPDPG